jgi:hypothetical protein
LAVTKQDLAKRQYKVSKNVSHVCVSVSHVRVGYGGNKSGDKNGQSHGKPQSSVQGFLSPTEAGFLKHLSAI